MSIFKQTFPDFVQEELKSRQERLGDPINRNALVNYQTSRNAWARMTSGVNVVVNGTPDDGALAKKYVLLGGTLKKTNITVSTSDGNTENTFSQKSGVGSSFDNNAYSNTGANGQKYLRGIRPMPGITNISTSTKAAYGSLIEVVVSFQCWDIRQLEDLELLYMRPGYTILIEWGWAYGGQTPVFYDILNKKDVDFQKVNKDLFDLSKESKGNYEAVLGYVKNYNWKARPDGGYDCTTSIISFGEVLESIKVNYAPYNIDIYTQKEYGLLKMGKYQIVEGNLTDKKIYTKDKVKADILQDQYSKGIIYGLFYEMRVLINQMPDIKDLLKDSANVSKDQYQNIYPTLFITSPDGINRTYSVFKKEWNYVQSSPEKIPESEKDFGNNSHYITLDSLCKLINNYVLIRNTKVTGSLLTEISVQDREYAGYSGPLTCLSHPLQVSTDPTKCLINAEKWFKKDITSQQVTDFNAIKSYPPELPINPNLRIFISNPTTENLLTIISVIGKGNINNNITLSQVFSEVRRQIENAIVDPINKNDNGSIIYNISSDGTKNGSNWGNISGENVVKDGRGISILGMINKSGNTVYEEMVDILKNDAELSRENLSTGTQRQSKYPISIRNYILNEVNKNQIQKIINEQLDYQLFKSNHARFLANQLTNKTITDASTSANKALQGLNFLRDYFVDKNYRLGYLSGIYVNLSYLMEVASNPNIESRDTSNKNTVSLINFFKEILRTIQQSLGNINNFDLHIDKDGIGRIIDINFTDDNNLSKNKDKIFQIEIHNLKSSIRNYQLESKIFPEQGTIVAISAQAEIPGRLGYNNSTLVEYNRGIQDRLIPKKESASDILASSNDLSPMLIKSFNQIQKYFNFLNTIQSNTGTSNTINTQYAPGQYNNALRDLIGLFNGVSKSNPNQFKAIIPVMLSFDMDGIGGIIIGNIFKINNNVLPSGYKNNNLGFLVKSFNHRIENSDWITTLEAYPVILEDEIDTNNYWNSAFNEVISSLNRIEESDIDLNNIQNVSPNASVASAIVPILNNKTNIPKGVKALIEAHAQIEGYYSNTRAFRNNNPGNLVYNSKYDKFGATQESQGRFAVFPTLEQGLDAKFDYIDRVNKKQHTRYPKGPNTTLLEYISTYAPKSDGNDPINYTTKIIGYFQKKGIVITPLTTIGQIFNIT